jgi:CRISPR-associated protein Cas2
MGMKATRMFYVIAYDVTNDKRRNRVVKLLKKYGRRSNYSVFECMITDAQLEKIRKSMQSIINTKEMDRVAFYPICVNCFTKISYYPPRDDSGSSQIVVI